MSRVDVAIPAPDGDCAATLHLPDGSGPWPAVLMYCDAGGVRETFLAMADRMSALGYATLLPNVYYRHGAYRPFDLSTAFSDPSERERLMTMARSVTAQMVAVDAGAFLGFLAERPEVAGSGVGTTGYCMGGRAATDDADSPFCLADRIRATVYVAAAENDASCPPDQLERLEKALAEAGVRHTIETYPAAHGFAVPDNPTYDAAADERHWSALEQLYASALRP
jgi:carboxymethylenebutenolidase